MSCSTLIWINHKFSGNYNNDNFLISWSVSGLEINPVNLKIKTRESRIYVEIPGTRHFFGTSGLRGHIFEKTKNLMYHRGVFVPHFKSLNGVLLVRKWGTDLQIHAYIHRYMFKYKPHWNSIGLFTYVFLA